MLILLVTFITFHLCFTLLLALAIRSWNSFKYQNRPPISIIIAARNEAENLKLLIPALLQQEYPKYEKTSNQGSQANLTAFTSAHHHTLHHPDTSIS